jgi:hypothetical protein
VKGRDVNTPAGRRRTADLDFGGFRYFRRWFLVDNAGSSHRTAVCAGGLAQLAQLAQAIWGDRKRWWPKRWSPAGVSTVVILSEAPVLSEAEGKDLIAACNWHEIPSAALSAGLRFSADQIRATQDDREENAHVPIPCS